jgi:hypothetical protein
VNRPALYHKSQFGDVAKFWSIYTSLNLNPWEKKAAARFDHYWKDAVENGRRMLKLHDSAQT